MPLFHQAVNVLEHAGVPREFWFRGQPHRVVRLLESWHESGEWWAGEAPRRVFRLLDQKGGAYELFKDLGEGRWYLAKIYD